MSSGKAVGKAARLQRRAWGALGALAALAILALGPGAAWAQFAGGGYDGYSSVVSADAAIGGKPVTMSGSANQVFMVSSAATAMAPVLITDVEGGAITALDASGDLRLRIPAGVSMTWDASQATTSLGGSAAGKCATTVAFEDANRTAKLDVTSNFAAGDTLVISGLRFTSFTAASAADRLDLDIGNADINYARDDKYVRILDASEVLPAGGAADGYDRSTSGDYPLDTNLTLEGTRLEGIRVE